MSTTHRKMIEETLFNLTYDMHTIGMEQEMREQLAQMSNADLIEIFNSIVDSLE